VDEKQLMSVAGRRSQVEIARRGVCPPKSAIWCDIRAKKYGASFRVMLGSWEYTGSAGLGVPV
jgi:hypothetical protein